MKQLADLLFQDVTETIDDLLNLYPRRDKDLVVTRFAPSPTGFLHIGGVYTALISRLFASQQNGIFFLRLEDTDKKREVENSKEIIIDIFNKLHIKIDEGFTLNDDLGEYGPYIQSKRVSIYHIMAKHLVEKGLAYPCFCSEKELEEIRAIQISRKETPGYYGEYAKYRNISYAEIQDKIRMNIPYVLRFRTPENGFDRVSYHDLIKGQIEMENNQNDFVLLKENGIPTYHFAHLCDDFLMGTTHVIRGDEWLSSVPMHLQLFEAFELEKPFYAHVAPIMKMDGDSRRKLSKRLDPESSATYYLEQGYPIKAIYTYLYTLINSNFESWFQENQDKHLDEFLINFENMSVGGPLYDLDKLNHISSEIIYLENQTLLNNILNWSKEYDLETYNLINQDLDLANKLVLTQGPFSNEHRKDLVKYADYKTIFMPFYELRPLNYEDLEEVYNKSTIEELIAFFKQNDTKTLKELSKELGYVDKKKYEKNPSEYRGITFQFYKLLRLLLTHQDHGISIDDILNILGTNVIIERLIKGLSLK